MYRYITLKELYELHLNNRIAIVVKSKQCKDIDSYINNCIITLQNEGFDINLFIKARVHKYNNNKHIVFIVRNEVKTLNKEQANILIRWADTMGNVDSLKDYIKCIMIQHSTNV